MAPYVYFFILFLQISCRLLQSQSVKVRRCDRADMSALIELNNSFIVVRGFGSRDPLAYPKTESWKIVSTGNGSLLDCCSWDGIECDNSTGHVIALNLSSSCLYGTINSSSSLFRLAHLQSLDLSDNHFNYSNIPSEIGMLSGLAHLNLSNSVFSGQVPVEISNLTKLSSLDLGCNGDYKICTELLKLRNPGLANLVQNFTSLQLLALDNVDLSSEVPVSISSLSSLTYLSLEYCRLRGVFPAPIFQLPKLEYISLGSNEDLVGYLPEFNSTSHLQVLQLNTTRFSGELPESLGNLRSLTFLDIESCNFSGSFPSSLGNLTELRYLSVRNNSFTAQTLDSMSWLWKLSKLDLLYIGRANLQGEIPSSIGNLTRLVTLGLAGNELKGEVPLELVNLPQLANLNLWENQLTGSVTYLLTNMSQISSLDLSGNYFDGPIPSSVSQLQNLQSLWLFGNMLSGTIELDTFLWMKKLRILQLSWNKLSCISRAQEYANSSQLQLIGLGSCNMTEFPSFVKEQNHITRLDLSSNNIRGEVPHWFLNMSVDSLQFLNLSGNGISGFDQNMTTLLWKKLDTLDLSSNSLQGSVPIPSASIRYYLASNNGLTGNFPETMCNLSSLVTVDLSFNLLSGILPSCSGNMSNVLSVLNLQSNRIHGTIPEFLIGRAQMKMIDLSQNELELQLPRSLANYPMLEFIDVGNNRLNDTFPSWLDSLPQLKVLILRSNHFHGVIGKPNSNSSFQRLRILDLSKNSFTGELPREYFPLWKSMQSFDNSTGDLSYMKQCPLQPCVPPQPFLYTSYGQYDYSMMMINKGIRMYYPKISEIFTVIDLSSNMFEGDIPDVIGELKALHLLNLSNNFLSGHIPPSMGNLGALESLDLSENRLFGEIPEELSRLNFLAVINVSYNNLSGPIPRGKQFDTFPQSSFEGNSALCGDAVYKKCEAVGTEPASGGDQDSNSSFEFDWKPVLIGWASGLIIGLVIGYIFISDKCSWFTMMNKKLEDRVYGRTHEDAMELNRDGELQEEAEITQEVPLDELNLKEEDTQVFIMEQFKP